MTMPQKAKKQSDCRANHHARSISFPMQLHEKVVDIAVADSKSFNFVIREAVERYIDHRESAKLQDKQRTGSLRK